MNNRGMITVDFLISIVIIMGFTQLMIVLTLTLSMASVTQYVTFAAARNYFAAHLDQNKQQERAIAKYQEIIGNDAMKSLYTGGWFIIDKEPTIGDHAAIIPGYNQAAGDTNKFWGAGTSFTAAALSLQIPFLGSTAPDDDGSGSGFKTYLGSYLGREPNADECLDFVAARWTAIRGLKSSGGGASYSTGTSTSGYYPQADDGC